MSYPLRVTIWYAVTLGIFAFLVLRTRQSWLSQPPATIALRDRRLHGAIVLFYVIATNPALDHLRGGTGYGDRFPLNILLLIAWLCLIVVGARRFATSFDTRFVGTHVIITSICLMICLFAFGL